MPVRTDASPIGRLVSAAVLYALAGVAQRGVGFLLIPVYTRLIDPRDYGVLEMLNAFSAIVFACLLIGLASAVNKCYHRDCENREERASILPTAMLLDLPVLLAGAVAILLFAKPISLWLIGSAGAADLLPLVVASGFCFSLTTLALANLRAQERASAFGALTLLQFIVGLLFNLLFVVSYGMGIRGVLWGNLLANAAAVPLALAAAYRGTVLRFDRRLAGPLLRFGCYLVPVVLAAWVMDLSDRYVLRLYRDLDEVAVYGIGYKFGMLLQLAIVWPFQLAWPAFSFSISREKHHRETYARTLTYLVAILVFGVVVISLLGRSVLPVMVGASYQHAYRVVPLIALAYALNGVYYCVAPGLHLTGNTKYQSVLALAAAALNLGLNFLLIPRLGMIGAAGATAAAFLFLALATALVAHRVYPIGYEYGRLLRAVGAGLAVYLAVILFPTGRSFGSLLFRAGAPIVVFPLALVAAGFLQDTDKTALRQLAQQVTLRLLPARWADLLRQ